MTHTFKRGDKVEHDSGLAGTAKGRVVRLYTDKEVAAHAKSHGPEAAARLQEWIVCKMADAHGEFTLAFHHTALRRAA